MTTHAFPSSSRLRVAPRYVVLATIVVALVVFFWVFDWNWLKHPIEHRAQAATGREFTINGDLKVHLGNAAWAADPDMTRIGKLEVGIRLLSLLHGSIDLPVVKLDKPCARQCGFQAGAKGFRQGRAGQARCEIKRGSSRG
jgi:uncharacterized protein involved in outer membrane biogenesis